MGRRYPFKRLFVNERRSRGFTLVEVLVVLSVFGILMTAMFLVFDMGLKAWQKISIKNELLQEAQVLNRKLTADLERAAMSSLSIDDAETTPTVAMLSALDEDGVFKSDHRGRPVWQKYLVYYLVKSEGVIYRREIPLIAGATQRRVATPIEYYNGGSGRRPILFYRSRGRPLSRFVKELKLEVRDDPVSQLRWVLTLERGVGSDKQETLTTDVAIHLRN